ncbi:MAG: hypothetical protein J7L43_00225 [Candidatus Aenigmarchaeota archaeon]|nr:hypothetical protein [Candidatus Aenigmarchaeota archaeon]
MSMITLVADILAIVAAIVAIFSARSARRYKNEIIGIQAKQKTSGIGNKATQKITGNMTGE